MWRSIATCRFLCSCHGLPQLSQLLFRRFIEYSWRDASPSGFKFSHFVNEDRLIRSFCASLCKHKRDICPLT